jgi:Ca2+-binding EF-hand superfamily protein
MKVYLFGGSVLAALFICAPAISQTVTSASATAQSPHSHRSFFTSNQNRSDVAAHVERMFKKLDLNHDGFITREEVATSQSQFNERMAKSEPKRAAKMFDRLDTNRDGEITEAEVAAARSARKHAVKKATKSSLFAKADANRDGIVTRAEFDAAASAGKIKVRHGGMRASALVRMFDLADSDKDGRVSLKEAQAAALQKFDSADLNHDGVLTPDERRQASKAERAKNRAA